MIRAVLKPGGAYHSPRAQESRKFQSNVKWNGHFYENPFGKCRVLSEVLLILRSERNFGNSWTILQILSFPGSISRNQVTWRGLGAKISSGWSVCLERIAYHDATVTPNGVFNKWQAPRMPRCGSLRQMPSVTNWPHWSFLWTFKNWS